MTPFTFKLDEVYHEEVKRLLAARQKSKIIHSTGDIDASGDELEEPFRDLLRRRLPKQFVVGHGHIVDRQLNVSRQFDVIIADNNATPILFEAENGCQYFPWESVYAVGEIKSTYVASKRQIPHFADSAQHLTTVLKRDATPSSYLGNGISLGPGMKLNDNRPLRNPLLRFIVFFDSGDASRNTLAQDYCSAADANLPLIAVFLDGSVVVKGELEPCEGGIKLGEITVDPTEVNTNPDNNWMHIVYKDPEKCGSRSLVIFMFALFNHLNTCILMPPPITSYLLAVLQTSANQPELLTVGGISKAAELSGKQLPKPFVEFLQKRADNGISPFSKIKESDMAEFYQQLQDSNVLAEFESLMDKSFPDGSECKP